MCTSIPALKRVLFSSSRRDSKLYVYIWRHSKFTEDVNWNKQKLCYCQSKDFSGKSDSVRYLKVLRTMSNEMAILILILS